MSPSIQSHAESRVQALLKQGIEAFNKADLGAAEMLFSEALKLAPESTGLHHNLALVLFHKGDHARAEAHLVHAARSGASIETAALLAQVYAATNRNEQALSLSAQVLTIDPGHFDTNMLVGQLREKQGDKARACEAYERAFKARPNDIGAGTKYSNALWAKEPERAVRVTQELLGHVGENLEARAAVLQTLMYQKEWWERIRRGLMPYHATSMDELLFHFARPEAEEFARVCEARAQAKPNNAGALRGLGTARFCLGDRHHADLLFKKAGQAGGHIFDAVDFDPAFYERLRDLGDAALTAGLPDVIPLTPRLGGHDPALYLSCNFFYFKAFALPLLCSLRERSPSTLVHVHIMDASEPEAIVARDFCRSLSQDRIALSVERPGLTNAPTMVARCYYHAIRFIRFHADLVAYKRPLWLMDVDAVINRDLSPLFSRLENHDVAMRVRPGRLEPWNQFNACVVGAAPTARGIAYLRDIAAYTAHFHGQLKLRWGIDQLAMYGVFADLEERGRAPAVALLGAKEVDYEYQDDGFVWCNSGIGKFSHLKRVANPETDNAIQGPMGDPFLSVFEGWWREARRIAQNVGWQV